jgi:GH24 family phage-related lysozyme (muramidase)
MGHYAMGMASMRVANNSDPHFMFNGIRYCRRNPMPQNVANQLLSTDLPRFEIPVHNFLSSNNITVNQHQFDALVSTTYQRGPSVWTVPTDIIALKEYLIEGNEFNNFEKAKAAFERTREGFISQGIQNRRIMEAEFFATGKYTDIR